MTAQPIGTDDTEIDAGSVTGTTTNRPKLLLIGDVHGENAVVSNGAIDKERRYFTGQGFDVQIAEQSACEISLEQISAKNPKAILVFSQHRSNGKGANESGVNRLRSLLPSQDLPYAILGADYVSYLGENQLAHDKITDSTKLAASQYIHARINGQDHVKAWTAAQPIASGCAR